MEAKATAKFVRMSPRKVRFVMDTIRGKYAAEALAQLQFTPNFAAVEIAKVVKSACANAQNNFGLNGDDLKIVRCYVDGGPTLKRVQPRAQGRAYRILKRTSHITVVVEDVERPRVSRQGKAAPVGRRQPLRAPLPGQTGPPSTPASVDETPQPADIAAETTMSAAPVEDTAPATDRTDEAPAAAATTDAPQSTGATETTDEAAAPAATDEKA